MGPARPHEAPLAGKRPVGQVSEGGRSCQRAPQKMRIIRNFGWPSPRERISFGLAMKPTSPRPARRNRSRSRERLLEVLLASDRHPTAAELFADLKGELPGLSLGTVYRNLEVLVAEGRAAEIGAAGGAMRYDGKLEPHQHFRCIRCGAIRDVWIELPAALGRSLKSRYRLAATAVSVEFRGECGACLPASRARSRRAPKLPARPALAAATCRSGSDRRRTPR